MTVFECPGERSSEDSTCSEDYRSTVWTTLDGNEWTQLNSASVSGTALNGAMTVFPVSVSQDLDRAASVVDLYTHALLVEYDGDDVNVAELPSSVTAACAAPDGVVVQLRADAADLDGGDEMTSTTAAPGDVPRPSFQFEPVEYVSMDGTVGRRIETDGGRLFCGDGEEFALISDSGMVTPVDASTFHVAKAVEGPPGGPALSFDRDASSATFYSEDGSSILSCTNDGCSTIYTAPREATWSIHDAATLVDGGLVILLQRFGPPRRAADETGAVGPSTSYTRVVYVPFP